MSESMSTTLNVRLNDDLEEQLEQFRTEQRITPSKSDVVRLALEELFDDELETDGQ